MINIEDFRPEPSKYKDLFKSLGVNQYILANYLGRSYQHTCRILRGYAPMPAAIEKKLKKLADQLQGE